MKLMWTLLVFALMVTIGRTHQEQNFDYRRGWGWDVRLLNGQYIASTFYRGHNWVTWPIFGGYPAVVYPCGATCTICGGTTTPGSQPPPSAGASAGATAEPSTVAPLPGNSPDIDEDIPDFDAVLEKLRQ
ncbi:uncharacterized protein [Drosophila pseudoobscura]|uniref:Uncharacterized protein n=1 Tax=Drosophila pseudoobscura pseudoobscura TaxID=46245 RepID=A0A6I8VY03_DROPS|nr:uncharacterized protein LOC117184037 [Drosophila pseudoobscura]